MKKYDSYKDSGIQWIGDLPSNWQIKRIKHTTYVKGRIGWQGLRSDEFLENSDSYVVTGTDFEKGLVKWDTCYQVPLERYLEDSFIQLQEGDLLITKDGTIGKIAVVKNIPKIATLNSGVFLTRPLSNSYFPEFMYWVLYSEVFKTFYDFNKSGSTIQHLYQNVFNEFKFPLPTRKEQTIIANYLYKKTTQIDDLIAKKERLIQLLEEERTAIINQAVTKGLDPTVPMKDSGIEWLGEIPAHWEVKKLKFLGSVIGGVTYSPNDVVENGDEGKLVMRSSNIQNGMLSLEDNVYVNLNIPEKQILRIGDILICSRNGSQHLIGKNICIEENMQGNTFGAFMVIYRTSYYKYLSWFFNSAIFKSQSGLYLTSTINQLTSGTLNNFFVTFPNETEQSAISSFIMNKVNEIKKIVSKTQQEIELLKEYKTALISEVVTGKVDVRNEK